MIRQLLAKGEASLGSDEIDGFADSLLSAIAAFRGEPRKVLIVPPDMTRAHSFAGSLTRAFARLLGPRLAGILPATGTHRPMDRAEISAMFGDLDPALFLEHDHRRGNVKLGELSPAIVEEVSGGKLSFPFPCEIDGRLIEGEYDLVLSPGQVVPHEVVGLANYTKNLIVGLGGSGAIALSHWLGAVAGLESIMGRADTPVRRLLDESAATFLSSLPVIYVLTVVARGERGLELRGLFAGDGPRASWLNGASARKGGFAEGNCFAAAAALSARLNIETVAEPIRRCIVALDRSEFRSTWLGNKAIYRTRMALADGAELFVMAPGVERFGEDLVIDRLIRRHGYRGTGATLAAVKSDPELAANLGAAAHLIHGSSEGRFRITYCTDSRLLSREEVEGVGYSWMDLAAAHDMLGVEDLAEGWNGGGDSKVFYVSNPALGLWKRADT
jgi:hypothetical protein